MLLSIGRLLLEALRFSATAAETWQELPLQRAFTYLVIGRLLNKAVPQSGLLYKARMLQQSGGAKLQDIASVFGTLAWMQLFFTLVLAIAALAFSQPGLLIAEVPVLPVLFVVCLLLLVCTAALASVARYTTPSPGQGRGRLEQFVCQTARTVHALFDLRTQPRLFTISAITVCSSVLLAILRLMLAYLMLSEHLEFSTSAVFVAVNRLLTLVAITPGNLGITELIYAGLSSQLGLGIAKGVAAAVVVRLVVFMTLLLCGALIALARPNMIRGKH